MEKVLPASFVRLPWNCSVCVCVCVHACVHVCMCECVRRERERELNFLMSQHILRKTQICTCTHRRMRGF